MRLGSYERLDVSRFAYFRDIPTPPSGAVVRRPYFPNGTDRIFLNLDAELTQTWDGGSVTVSDGDVVLLPRKVAYTDRIGLPGRSLIVHLDLAPELPDGIYKWSFAGNADMAQHFFTIGKLWKQKKTGWYVACMNELYAILSMIIRSEKSVYTCSAQAAAVEPAVAYLKANFPDASLEIPRLAELCGMSYSHFRKLFYDVHGVSAIGYLKKLRLDNACQLLSLGGCTVAQAAALSGFSDVYYFSGFFKRMTGMTPTEYRNRRP